MSLKKSYKPSIDAVWSQYADGVELHLHRAGPTNPAYARAMEKHFGAHRGRLADRLDAELSRKLMAEVYADSIVKGWRTKKTVEVDGVANEQVTETVELDEGQPLQFSRANVIAVLTAVPDFFLRVQEDAGNLAMFRAAEVEADVKN